MARSKTRPKPVEQIVSLRDLIVEETCQWADACAEGDQERRERLERRLRLWVACLRDAIVEAAAMAQRGLSMPYAKLTEVQVREIRAALDQGEARKALVARYSVSAATVDQIATGRAWRHLTMRGGSTDV